MCSISPICCMQNKWLGSRRNWNSAKYLHHNSSRRISTRVSTRASMIDSFDSSIKRMERAWLISQQPMPVSCSSCDSKGHVDCKWCGGTGFFIIGDNMLCQVPSRNTSCVICAGKGSSCCPDCKGTGFRAKWLE